MMAYDEIDVVEPVVSADEADATVWVGLSTLCDSDGYDLECGQMVRVPGLSGWWEIITLEASGRIEVEGPDGDIRGVLASSVTIL